MRRSWWDDYVAFLPLVLDPTYWMLTLIRFNHRGKSLTLSAALRILGGSDRSEYIVRDLTHPTQTFRVLNSFWLSLLPYLLIVWCVLSSILLMKPTSNMMNFSRSTRVALALSLGRIFPLKHPARRWSYVLVGIMIVSCIASILVSNLTCTYTSSLLVLFEVTHCDTGAGGFLIQTIFLFAGKYT